MAVDPGQVLFDLNPAGLPKGVLAAGAMALAWIAARMLRALIVIVPGLVLGGALAWALAVPAGWGPIAAIAAGLMLGLVLTLAVMLVAAARLILVALLAPAAVIALALVATAMLGRWWALPVIGWGLWLVIGLARRLLDAHEGPLAVWIADWIEDLRDP